MADEFINAGIASVNNVSADTLYTCPAATKVVVHTLDFANIDGALPTTITITLHDDSAAADIVLAKDIPLPAQSVYTHDRKIVLEESDYINVQASDASAASAFLCGVEIS